MIGARIDLDQRDAHSIRQAFNEEKGEKRWQLPQLDGSPMADKSA
jgi:hypothetical protein